MAQNPGTAPKGNNKLTPEETIELSKRAEQGDRAAREALILDNLDFVKRMANKHRNKGVPVDDLYQEGCYGLIRAVDNYKYQPGASFQTYAWYYINKYIQQALIDQSDRSPIKLSPEYHRYTQHYKNVLSQLESNFGRPPTDEELAKELKISPAQVKKVRANVFFYVPIDDESKINNPSVSNARLNIELISSTPDVLRPTEEAALSLIAPKNTFLEELLPPQDFDVLCRRIGLTETGEKETYPAIAKALGISIDSARRTFARAIRTIRKALEA